MNIIDKWSEHIRYTKNNPLPAGYNHEWSKKYNSNWDYIKTEFSNYHFDNFRKEQEGDYWTRLGRFEGDFAQAAEEIIEKSKELTWRDISDQGLRGFPEGTPVIEQEDYDRRKLHNLPDNKTLLVMGKDLGQWPVIQRMIDFWALEDARPRIQNLQPGEVFEVHIDKLWHQCPLEPERIVRIHIMLQDWKPGQFMSYGNMVYSQWRAGEIHTFDHWNIPHTTSNLGFHYRPMLSIIGNRTARTNEILESASIDSVFKI
jgi:hypothetical protein